MSANKKQKFSNQSISGPRAKTEFQTEVERLKRAIRKKDDWKEKIQNPVVRKRYIEEALAQGASQEIIDVALEELDVYENSSDNYDMRNIASDHLIRHFDELIPETLRQKLEIQLDEIANLPEKDFHPGSNDKVQDLIHPSLFPYINPNIEGPNLDTIILPTKQSDNNNNALSSLEGLSPEILVKQLNDNFQRRKAVEILVEQTKSKQTTKALVEAGVIKPLCDLLTPNKTPQALLAVLKCLENILEHGTKEIQTTGFNRYANLIEEAEGLYHIEQLQTHEDVTVYEKSIYLLEKYFIAEEDSHFGRHYEVSRYQWLPSIFHVSEDNKVTTRSYVNNLDRQEYPHLYETISQVFEAIWPQLNRCVRDILATFNSPNRRRYEHLNLPITERHLGIPQTCMDEEEMDDNARKRKIENRRYEISEDICRKADELNENWLVNGELQVIVKACNYVIKPGDTYEGVWHVEGMSHENILASAIYYYSTSPDLQDEGLAFRIENNYSDGFGPPGMPKWQKNTPLGAIRTTQGRVIMFSNQYQHKVTLLQNRGNTTATRKILCFFIVDPRNPIMSSRDIPAQQWEKERKKKIKMLLMIARRRGLKIPKDVMQVIMEYARTGMTLEEAMKHRLVLMDQRKYIINTENERIEREFSLCEH